MKPLLIQNWGAVTSITNRSIPTASLQADPGKRFCGICFGTSSDEGLVIVNGYTLVAGHVLPIAADSYQITGIVPRWSSGDATGTANPPGQNGITLQLFGLETESEMLAAADLIRGPRVIDAQNVTVSTIAAATFAAGPSAAVCFQVPFVGRYRCLFSIQINDSTPNNFNYAVEGIRWSPTFGAFRQTVLTTQLNVQKDADNRVSFYIEDETWDMLQLDCSFSAAPSNALIEVCTTVTAEIQA